MAHEDIISILTRLIDNDNLPHLLLYGPPGTGKVSFVAIGLGAWHEDKDCLTLELTSPLTPPFAFATWFTMRIQPVAARKRSLRYCFAVPTLENKNFRRPQSSRPRSGCTDPPAPTPPWPSS